jgi:Cupin domain
VETLLGRPQPAVPCTPGRQDGTPGWLEGWDGPASGGLGLAREDELCLVMDGQVGWRVGDRELGLAPGSANLPAPGVPHAYWNPGRSSARLVLVSVPGAWRGSSRKLVAGSMEAERTAAVAARYGLVLVSARRSRHGLQQEAEQADPVRSAMAFKRAMVGCLVWSR